MKRLRDVVGIQEGAVIPFPTKKSTMSSVPTNSIYTKVYNQTYTWGKYVTIQHGYDVTIPLRQDSIDLINNLRHGETKTLKIDRHKGWPWTATRHNDDIHFSTATIKDPIVTKRNDIVTCEEK